MKIVSNFLAFLATIAIDNQQNVDSVSKYKSHWSNHIKYAMKRLSFVALKKKMTYVNIFEWRTFVGLHFYHFLGVCSWKCGSNKQYKIKRERKKNITGISFEMRVEWRVCMGAMAKKAIQSKTRKKIHEIYTLHVCTIYVV